jgi:hypothetical protein
MSKWRLPTIKELMSLVDYKKCDPASYIEDMESAGYWSCTSSTAAANYCWVVYFTFGGNGYCDPYMPSAKHFVICIRDTENGIEWSKSSTNQMTYAKALDYADSLNNPMLTEEELETLKHLLDKASKGFKCN